MNIIRNRNAEILDSKNSVYDVSICVITYNKADYIKEAIDSVLMQETDCTYEIVVGDNDSTDGTKEILKKYWSRYPDKFTLILNNKNLGLPINMYNTMAKAKGKYIIILYGDDYWISPHKLQTQYDFLEHNQDFIGVTSAIEYRYNGEKKAFKTLPCKRSRNTVCTLKKYMKGFDFPMAGVLIRNDVFSKNSDHFEKMIKASRFVDDASFCILLLMKGNVFVLPEAMGAYRCFRKGENANNFNSVNPIKKRAKISIELCNNLDVLTGNRLDFSMRYGFVLQSVWQAVLKREISFHDYTDIVQMMQPQYRKKHYCLLMKGIYRKLTLALG